MPWSDWQTADVLDVGADVLGLEWHFDNLHGGYDENVVNAMTTGPNLYCLRQYGTGSDGVFSDDGTTRARQHTAPSDWATQRDWFPHLLSTLRENVDYSVRPDRTGSEDDAYVEYEAGDNVHTSWDMGGFTLTAIQPDYVSAFAWNVGIDVGTSYAAPTAPTPIPSIGTVIASGDQSTPANTHFPPPPDPTPAKSFTISVEIPTSSIRPIPGVDPSLPPPTPQLSGFMYPSMHVQPPRWRYWIPDTTPLPLRQRQRDDGLGMNGVARWRGGSSRQTSNRWHGYL